MIGENLERRAQEVMTPFHQTLFNRQTFPFARRVSLLRGRQLTRVVRHRVPNLRVLLK